MLQLMTYLSESSTEIEPENESLRACWLEFLALDRDLARLRQALSEAAIEEWCVCFCIHLTRILDLIRQDVGAGVCAIAALC